MARTVQRRARACTVFQRTAQQRRVPIVGQEVGSILQGNPPGIVHLAIGRTLRGVSMPNPVHNEHLEVIAVAMSDDPARRFDHRELLDRTFDVQGLLADREQHRLPIPDLGVAAAADSPGLTVLCDDFEGIAEITDQAHNWIVRRGSV